MENHWTILITGGLGYIGSHTAVLLAQAGHDIIIVDNLSNSYLTTLYKIQELTGKDDIIFYEADLKNKDKIEKIFTNHPEIDTVIHFAGKKAVGESCQSPFLYYENNIQASIQLYNLMLKYGVKNIVFSSSATVYDTTKGIPPYSEGDRLNTANPYGSTKLINEYILKDLAHHKGLNTILLRYFNPIGAHESGLIGENPKGIPNNLLPYVLKVANGEIEELEVFGDDYETEDGTGVRDYIHVEDLAQAHVDAYNYLIKVLQDNPEKVVDTFNIGTGNGTSVLQIVEIARQVTEKEIKYKIAPRRDGDAGTVICSPQKAKQILGRNPEKTIYDAIQSSWNFIQKNNEK